MQACSPFHMISSDKTVEMAECCQQRADTVMPHQGGQDCSQHSTGACVPAHELALASADELEMQHSIGLGAVLPHRSTKPGNHGKSPQLMLLVGRACIQSKGTATLGILRWLPEPAHMPGTLSSGLVDRSVRA